jgi:excinuclease UvrABC helicase subunit UvrB
VRINLLRDLRLGELDVRVGINLLRDCLDPGSPPGSALQIPGFTARW